MFTTHAAPKESRKCYLLNTPQAASLLPAEQPFVLHEEIFPVPHQNDLSCGNTQGSVNICLFSLKYVLKAAMVKWVFTNSEIPRYG